MPYTFYEGFGNYQVLNDLRLRGYYAGTSATITMNPALPWGATAICNTSVNFANAGAGNNVNDPFCAPLSGKTMGELWASGGFAISWRQQTFVPNAHLRMPSWDGSRYVWPLGPGMTGSYIGVSPNGSYWEFRTAAGAQGEATNNTGSTASVFDSVTGQTIWLERSGTTPFAITARYGTVDGGFSTSGTITAGGTNPTALNIYTSQGRTVMVGGNGTSPYCLYSDSGGAGPWVQGSGLTGNTDATGVVRSTAFPNTWIVLRGSGYQASTDNMVTFGAFTGISGASSLNCVAASPTSIIIGHGTGIARATSQNLLTADWTVTALGASNVFRGIAYGGGRWVAIATSGAVYVSTDDGLTWAQSATLPFMYGTSAMLSGTTVLSYQNGRFLYWALAQGCFAESLDGINWRILALPYPTTTGGVDAASLNTLTGLFLSSTLPTPTWTGFGTGITWPSSSVFNQNTNMCGYANVSGGGAVNSTVLMGPGNWHEVQVIMRPTSTPEQWTVTYGIDDWVSAPVTLTYANSTPYYPWFNLSRRAAVSNLGNLVFYEFEGASDPLAQLGPDLRIYTERPNVDEQTEWNRTDGTTSNAQAVATGTVTNATTQISEAGVDKTDQYRVSNSVPTEVKILSVQNETYFSRMLPNTTYVSVGTQVSGQNIDTPPVQVVSPTNSWAYVTQRLDRNPVTGTNWTYAQATQSRMRITRNADTPVTVALIHCDGVQGATTVPYAINVGGGSNVATGSAIVTTTDSKFGGSCLQIPSGSIWNFAGAFGGPGNNLGLSDFTIECWVKTTATGNACMFAMDTNLAGSSFGGMLLTPAGLYMSNANAAWNLSARPSGSFNNGAWRHIALCRQGPNFYLWIDGQPATNSPATNTDGISVRGGQGVLSFGAASGNVFTGLIDEIRVSRGCRYTTAFTPPTEPFTS